MQCVSCSMEVSPNFVAAIAENKCPACGKQLLDTSDYKKIFALKKLLSALGLGLADPMLVKLAAAINSKFELWPKESGPPPVATAETTPSAPVPAPQIAQHEVVADPTLVAKQKQQMISKLSKAMEAVERGPVEIHELEESFVDEDADLSTAEKAKLMQEYGLLNDTSGVQLDSSTSPQMARELAELMSAETFPIEENMAEADRMARARGLKSQVRMSGMGGGLNRFGIKPIQKVGDR